MTDILTTITKADVSELEDKLTEALHDEVVKSIVQKFINIHLEYVNGSQCYIDRDGKIVVLAGTDGDILFAFDIFSVVETMVREKEPEGSEAVVELRTVFSRCLAILDKYEA